MLEKLKILIKEFEELQKKNSSFGAFDSEPDWVFQKLIRKAFEEGVAKVPTTGYGWDLYISSMDCEEAAKQLHNKATEVVDVVIQGRNDKQVRDFVHEYCWR